MFDEAWLEASEAGKAPQAEEEAPERLPDWLIPFDKKDPTK